MNRLHTIQSRSFATSGRMAHPIPKRVMGLGSNVVDIFHKVQSLPAPGEKGFFQSPTEPVSGHIVGGVTLNHLCWARLLGTPTALLALQGTDSNGELIRSTLENEFDVGIDTIDVTSSHVTSLSHIFLDANGERCIMMASGSTSTLNSDIINNLFYDKIKESCSMITTEISQVPLNAVLRLLDIGNELNIPSILDIDIPPSVAVNDACLGSFDEILECIEKATVVKPTLSAAVELLVNDDMGERSNKNINININEDSESGIGNVSQAMQSKFGNKLIAVTNGSDGAAFTNRLNETVLIPILPDIKQIDSTGAGDAFFGGIISGINCNNMQIPDSIEEMEIIGNIARVSGASCCEILGALPLLENDQTKNRMIYLDRYNINTKNLQFKIEKLIEKYPIPNVTAGRSNIDKNTESNKGQNVKTQGSQMSALEESISNDYKAVESLNSKINKDKWNMLIDGLMYFYKSGKRGSSKLYITGIGKSGIVGQRLASAMASLSFNASYIHGSEWVHGEMGRLYSLDDADTTSKVQVKVSSDQPDPDSETAIVVLSASGKTPELYHALKEIRLQHSHMLIAGLFCCNEDEIVEIEKNSSTWIGECCDIVVGLGNECMNYELLDKVPTRSIIVQETVVNAILTDLAKRCNIDAKEFVKNHPGGTIGAKTK